MKILEFLKKNKLEVIIVCLIVLVTIFSFIIRYSLIDIESNDYRLYLSKWFDTLKAGGGMHSLNQDIGDYNAPYVTILAILTYLPVDSLVSIKCVSIIFDYICAIAAMILVYKLFEDKKEKLIYSTIAYTVVTLLPTVIINSSLWAQSDSIYAAFILFSLVFLIDKKYIRSFVFLGIAFAFKLQFIFILPLYVLVFLSRFKKENEDRIPFYYFFIIPIVNAIMCLPSIIFGKSIMSCIGVYINQTSTYERYISLNFPGIHNFIFEVTETVVRSPGKIFAWIFIGITGFVLLITAIIVIVKKVKFDKKRMIEFGLWSILITTFFLPHMHDRYIYVADILSVIYFIMSKDIKKIYLPIGINTISLCTYINFLSGIDINIKILSMIYFVIVTKLTYDIFKPIFTKTEGGKGKLKLQKS